MTRGVPVRTPRRCWTTREVERLYELAETLSTPDIATKLDRSENSIKVKLRRLKVSRRVRSGWFTEQEVCEILGVDHKWVSSRGVRKTPFNACHPPRKGKSTPWKILETDLRDFIRKCPEELVGRDLDIIMVVDILAGVKSSCQECR